MASQNKIVLEINGKLTNTIYIDNIKKGKVLFSFNESDDVILYNHSPKYEVKVESINDNDDFETISKSSSERINKRDDPRVPLHYQIQFIDLDTKQVKIAYFEVKPLTVLSKNFYEFMVNSLKNFNDNLLFDHEKKKDLYRKDELFSSFNESNFLYKTDEEFNVVISSINRLKENLNFDLDKVIVRRGAYKKQDSKTIIKNSLNEISDKVYSTTKVRNYDTNENRYLLKIVREIVKSVKLNLASANDRNKELLIINENKTKLIRESSLKDQAFDRVMQDISTREKAIDRNTHAIGNMCRVLYSFNELITFLINNGVKDDVTSKITRSFFALKSYLFFYKNIYENFILKKDGSNFLNNINGSSIYNTSKLFEHFLLYCFDNALMYFNFKRVGDENLLNFDPLLNEKEFCYEDKYFVVKISYEKKINSYSEKNKDDYYLIRGNHNTPDYIISIFDHNDKLIYSAIIDAKCRKVNSLKKSLEDDKQNAATKDYLDIVYSKVGNSYINSKRIDELIYVYPSDESEIDENKFYGYVLISKAMNDGNEDIKKMFSILLGRAVDKKNSMINYKRYLAQQKNK